MPAACQRAASRLPRAHEKRTRTHARAHARMRTHDAHAHVRTRCTRAARTHVLAQVINFGNCSMTLIDTLDTLVIMGNVRACAAVRACVLAVRAVRAV